VISTFVYCSGFTYRLPFSFRLGSSLSSSCLLFFEPSFSRLDVARLRLRVLGGELGGDRGDS
jgi:hypothetical protein